MTGAREETNKKGSTVPTADYIGHGRELAVLLSINHVYGPAGICWAVAESKVYSLTIFHKMYWRPRQIQLASADACVRQIISPISSIGFYFLFEYFKY